MPIRKRGIIIAIDGPTASGKSTTAERVADRLCYLHINTGAMYRAFALLAKKSGVKKSEADKIRELLASADITFNAAGKISLNGEDVSSKVSAPDIALLASELSTLPEVREKLVASQRELGRDGGVVLEGRDIGTVVFPDAELKIFLIADQEIRAKRRQQELAASGRTLSLEEVKAQLAERDRRDLEREISPLRKAPDAIEVDTSALSMKEQVDRIVSLARP
jgi:cytidylate kinase